MIHNIFVNLHGQDQGWAYYKAFIVLVLILTKEYF